jgi:hypothetical protein
LKEYFPDLSEQIEKAVEHMEFCIKKKPVCYTAPTLAIPLIKFRKLMMKLGAK